MNIDVISHNFLLFCCVIEVARQWLFVIFVRWVFVSKISSNSIAFKRLTPTQVRTNFFNQIYHILASFASYCPLSTRPNVVAHTSSSTSSLTFSSISWVGRHTSWCVAFSCSTANGTASQLWSTFHILWHFFGWLSGDKAKRLWPIRIRRIEARICIHSRCEPTQYERPMQEGCKRKLMGL